MASEQEIKETVGQLKNIIERLGKLNVSVYTIVGSIEEGGPLVSITTMNDITNMLKLINKAKRDLEIQHKKMIAQNN